MEHAGKVKWFDVRRGYGFIETAGGPDVFFHASVAGQYGLTERQLEPGTPVRFSYMREAQRGPAADALRAV